MLVCYSCAEQINSIKSKQFYVDLNKRYYFDFNLWLNKHLISVINKIKIIRVEGSLWFGNKEMQTTSAKAIRKQCTVLVKQIKRAGLIQSDEVISVSAFLY